MFVHFEDGLCDIVLVPPLLRCTRKSGIQWYPSVDSLPAQKEQISGNSVSAKSDKWARVYPWWPTNANFAKPRTINAPWTFEKLLFGDAVGVVKLLSLYYTSKVLLESFLLFLSCCHICSFWLLTILKTCSMVICWLALTILPPPTLPSLASFFISVTIFHCRAASFAMSAWNLITWKLIFINNLINTRFVINVTLYFQLFEGPLPNLLVSQLLLVVSLLLQPLLAAHGNVGEVVVAQDPAHHPTLHVVVRLQLRQKSFEHGRSSTTVYFCHIIVAIPKWSDLDAHSMLRKLATLEDPHIRNFRHFLANHCSVASLPVGAANEYHNRLTIGGCGGRRGWWLNISKNLSKQFVLELWRRSRFQYFKNISYCIIVVVAIAHTISCRGWC